LHRYDYGGFWPNLRESDFDYIGEKEGKGYNINIPLNKVKYIVYLSIIIFKNELKIYLFRLGLVIVNT